MELKRDNYGCFVKTQTKEMEKLKAKGVQEHKPFEGIAFKEQSLLLGVGGILPKCVCGELNRYFWQTLIISWFSSVG